MQYKGAGHHDAIRSCFSSRCRSHDTTTAGRCRWSPGSSSRFLAGAKRRFGSDSNRGGRTALRATAGAAVGCSGLGMRTQTCSRRGPVRVFRPPSTPRMCFHWRRLWCPREWPRTESNLQPSRFRRDFVHGMRTSSSKPISTRVDSVGAYSDRIGACPNMSSTDGLSGQSLPI